MKTVIAIAASVLVNASLVVAFERSAIDATPVPAGEVIVTDLSLELASTLAQASLPTQSQARTL